VIFALGLVILVPVVVQQVLNFVEQVPGYVSRLQNLLAEQGAP
jgi:predicted PurR-regulated permease PerM